MSHSKLLAYLVKREKNDTLTGEDIADALNDKCKIVTYSELQDFDSLDDLMDFNAVILLYEFPGESVGHWVSITFNPDKQLLSFYDPYGFAPDQAGELKGSKSRLLSMMVREYCALKRCLFEYNSQQMQQFGEQINVCGRYCIIRVLMKDLDNAQFNAMLSEKHTIRSADDMVTLLTFSIKL